jgi:uncharacterized protein
MRVEVEKVDAKGANFAHAYAAEELSLEHEDLRLIEGPEISGRMQREGRKVRLRGKIRAKAQLDCDRCLAPVDLPVEADFDVGYVPVSDFATDEDVELQDEDVSLSVFEGGAIDIDELVREQLLLALPTRALCRDECAGLCAICGVNKNLKSCDCHTMEIDPRWQALKELK